MPIASVLQFFAPGVATISKRLQHLLSPQDLEALKAGQARLEGQGVPAALAGEVARLDAMYSVLDIVENAQELDRPVELAAQVYFALAGKLDMRWISAQVSALQSNTHWRAMARAAMRDDLANLQSQLTAGVLRLSPSVSDPLKLTAAWEAHQEKALAHMREVQADLKLTRVCDLAMLSVLLRELRMLA